MKPMAPSKPCSSCCTSPTIGGWHCPEIEWSAQCVDCQEAERKVKSHTNDRQQSLRVAHHKRFPRKLYQ
jgi:hypothetical protein